MDMLFHSIHPSTFITITMLYICTYVHIMYVGWALAMQYQITRNDETTKIGGISMTKIGNHDDFDENVFLSSLKSFNVYYET